MIVSNGITASASKFTTVPERMTTIRLKSRNSRMVALIARTPETVGGPLLTDFTTSVVTIAKSGRESKMLGLSWERTILRTFMRRYGDLWIPTEEMPKDRKKWTGGVKWSIRCAC